MDFKLSEEETLIQRSAARFVERELLPQEGAYLRQKEPFLSPGDPPRRALDDGILPMLAERAKKAGLWALDLAESAGGSAMSAVAQVLIRREFGGTVVPFEPPMVPRIMGSSPFAEKLAAGEVSLSFVSSEIHETGTPSRVRTEYRQERGEYRFNGSGLEVMNPATDLFLLPARERVIGRTSLFVVDRNAPGLSFGNSVDLINDVEVGRMMLRECRAPTNHLVGHEYELCEVIAAEQLRIAGRSLGIGKRCVEGSLAHARDRVTFGRPLASRQAIQWMLADLSLQLRTCTWLTLEAAWRADQELPYFESAALAKKRAAKMAFEAADVAIQIHGGYGVCRDLPYEGFYREARMLRLLYGAESEIDRARGEKALQAGDHTGL